MWAPEKGGVGEEDEGMGVVGVGVDEVGGLGVWGSARGFGGAVVGVVGADPSSSVSCSTCSTSSSVSSGDPASTSTFGTFFFFSFVGSFSFVASFSFVVVFLTLVVVFVVVVPSFFTFLTSLSFVSLSLASLVSTLEAVEGRFFSAEEGPSFVVAAFLVNVGVVGFESGVSFSLVAAGFLGAGADAGLFSGDAGGGAALPTGSLVGVFLIAGFLSAVLILPITR